MDYENMRVAELKALARELELRGYFQLTKAELIALLRPALRTRPPRPNRPHPPPSQLVRFRQDRPRQLSPQEMNIFDQQEMSKSRPQVTSKLNDWYDWLISHLPKTKKNGASGSFKTSKDKIMGLYNRVTGNQTQLEELKESEPYNPIELEQAFYGAYRSYRINGRSRMEVDTLLTVS